MVNGLYPERYTKAEAEKLRAAAENGLDPGAVSSVRAALAEHERARAQRSHLQRLKKDAGAPVMTLPFLFEPEVGLPEYERLAKELERKL